jgi:hypothetical protein
VSINKLCLASVAALLAVAVLGGASQAIAHERAYKSRVTLRVVGPGTWEGRVTSASPGCGAHRKVIVFTADGNRVADTTSERDGSWSLAIVGESYYAKVTREARGRAGHRRICLPDRSPTRTAPAGLSAVAR